MNPPRLTFGQKIFLLFDWLMSRLRVRFYRVGGRFHGAKIAPSCRIGRGCELALFRFPARRGALFLGPNCELSAGCILHPYSGKIHLGENVFLGPHVVIYGHGGVEIGENTLVSMHCSIVSSNHTVPPAGTDIRSQPDLPLAVKIGRDVWLGAGVRVLGGVTIGDGCVVGAGSVVTKDLPPQSIAMGVPAVVVRSRSGS